MKHLPYDARPSPAPIIKTDERCDGAGRVERTCWARLRLVVGEKLLPAHGFMSISAAAILITIKIAALPFLSHLSLSYRSDAKTFPHSSGISSDS
jgi:hypothetical protein